MKNIHLYILALCCFLLIQCTPKTTETMVEEVKEEVMQENPLAWRATAPAPGEARKIKMGTYNNFQLANGLEVIVVENNKIPKVSYSVSLKNDPVPEEGQTGYISIAGDMISRGTASKSKAEIDEAIDFIGASLSTSSGGLFASSLKKHSDALLEVASDVLMNPVFLEEEFDKVKNQVLSGIQSEKSDPNSMASNVSSVLNYGTDHPYGEIQTEETINSIDPANCKKYYDTYFRPNNAYLTIVGDISLEEAKANAEKYFGAWEKGDIPEIQYVKPSAPDGSQVSFVNKDGAVQSVINITYPLDLKPNTKESMVASLTNSILGGGIFLGRLMQNLREDKAFTYGARSRLSADDLAGEFTAFASVRNEVTDSSVTEFLYEMNRIATADVSEEDLQLAKNSAAGGFARSLESPQTIARFARNIVKYDLPKDYYETYLERLDQITIEDVKSTAKKYIRPDNANILVVGNKDEVAQKLLQFDADGKIDYFDAFGLPVVIDETPISSDITPESIIENYLAAIGGKENLMKVNTIEQHMTMALMGQEASIKSYKYQGEKSAMMIEMNGMTVQSQIYDGSKVAIAGMGGNQTFEEGPEFESAKDQTAMIEQLLYTEEYELELKGSDQVNGESCYKLNVTGPSGKTKTEFYSKDSGLMLKQVSVEGENTITVTISDYEEVDGYLFPKKLVTEGAMPVPMEMKVTETKVNSELDMEIFKID